MITECAVLFRIQYFQQGCCRVTVMRNTQFIHFIKQDQRIHCTCLFHGIDDSTGHCADICSSVAADLCFILHAAQRHSHIFSVHRFCNGTSDGCFTYTGRAHQTKDGRIFLRCILANRKEFQHTFFYLFHAVVVFIQNFRCLFQVKSFFCSFCPGQRKHGFDISSGNIRLRRSHRDLHHAVDFLFHHFFHMFGRVLFFQLFTIFCRISTYAVLIAQFFLNHFQFFSQIIFSLILVDFLFCFVFDFSFDVQNFSFFLHQCDHRLQSFKGIQDINKFLFAVEGQFQTCCHHIGQLTGFCGRKHIAHQIHRRCIGRQFQIFFIFFHRDFHDGLNLFGRLFIKILRNRCDFTVIAVFHMDIFQSAAAFAFYDHMCQVTGQFQHLFQFRQHTNIIQITSGRIRYIRVSLCHQKDFFSIFFCCLQCIQRFLSACGEADSHTREYTQAAQSNHRHDDRLFFLHFLHLI